MFIYLVRHGNVNNPQNILPGRLPGFQLSDKGRKEIFQTAKFLKNKKITQIYTSPILRTKQTATIIQSILKKPLHISSDILEIKISIQGCPSSFAKEINWDFYFSHHHKPTDEKIEEILQRMLKFVKKIYKKSLMNLLWWLVMEILS